MRPPKATTIRVHFIKRVLKFVEINAPHTLQLLGKKESLLYTQEPIQITETILKTLTVPDSQPFRDIAVVAPVVCRLPVYATPPTSSCGSDCHNPASFPSNPCTANILPHPSCKAATH
ncbi:hypothetical protein FRX31_018563 [Thalictrum thalictroides]|uniref:Uncharacterized protein n=1 Tax=Thalictrum thalictroides TaxID=46969 RepID=A0A7J6W4W0_THATH|nr:hypothetical protein FRX31_018563 [Thalictrum thalictroides]